MRMTSEQAERIIEEQNRKLRISISKRTGNYEYEPDDGPESKLSKKIRGYCKDHGYPAQINRQSPKAKGLLEPGWPDVTMCMHDRVLFLELKTGKGKLSEDQVKIKLQFLALGQEWHEVQSYRQFLDIVEGIS